MNVIMLNEILKKHKMWLDDEKNGERANLRGANLSGANLRGADLSGAENLLSAVDYIKNNFECTAEGIIAYKVFGAIYSTPTKWEIHLKSVITENVDANRTNDCGCGINVATLEWVLSEYSEEEIWKVLIRWEWMCGVVVPYNTDGKIRCERVELVEKINKKESQT